VLGAESLHQTVCRRSGSTLDPAATWNFDGHDGMSASFTRSGTGTVKLVCRVRFREPATSVTLKHDRVLVSFLPAVSRALGSGVRIEVGGCSIAYLRVAGEDWIEAGKRAWNVNLPAATREVIVRIDATDVSRADPMRVDLSGVAVSPGAGAEALPCPLLPE
jgi:hypothetical protein